MNILQQVPRRLERLEALDKVAKPLAGALGRAVSPTDKPGSTDRYGARLLMPFVLLTAAGAWLFRRWRPPAAISPVTSASWSCWFAGGT
jgi:hypothetical protein